jgi:PAS domain S-box-containing protein
MKRRIVQGNAPYLWRYGVAIVSVTLALLLTLILHSLLHPSIFSLFYPAVLISALRGGNGPGLLATGLSILAVRYFLMAPPYSLLIAGSNDFARLTLFSAVMLLIHFISLDLRHSRKQTDISVKQLQTNEKRIQLALKSADVTLLQQDTDLRYQWIDNPQNYPVSSVLGKTDYDLFSPEEAEQLTAIKRRVLASGVATHEEVQIRVADQLRYYDLRVEPLRNEYGHISGISCAAVDITNYKTTQTALQESDSRFRRLIESNLFGVSIGELDGGILEANHALLKMMGYTRDDLDAGALSWQQVTPPEYLPLDAKAGDELRANGFFTPFEKEYIRADGSRVPVLIGGALLEATPDRPPKVICFHLDLSELRRTATELRRAKERFEIATSAVRGLVYEWNARTNVMERTRGLMDVVGYAPDEAEPTVDWWMQLVHPDDLERLNQTMQNLLGSHTDSFAIDYRVRHRDGQYRYIWDQGKIYRDIAGTVVRTVGFSLDISDRKQTEDALRESEERFRMMADAAPVMVWMSGLDNQCSYVNQGWLTFTGRTLEQEIGNGWMEGIHPEDFQHCLTAYETAFNARQPFTIEYRLRRFDGEYGWILDNGAPRFTPDGCFLGYVGSCIDISDRKRIEDAQTYLVEASDVLASSLDYQTTLSSLVYLTVPRLADWCSIHILEEDGSVQQVATAHIDPDKVAWAEAFRRKYPINLNADTGVAQVLRSGQSELYPYISDDMLVEATSDSDYLNAIRALGLHSVMIVPLRIHTRILGTISFVFAESGRHYTQADLTLAEELARRAALAVENARLYRRAQRDRAVAEAANRSKDEFLATLSHELRTPLNAMLGWMQMLTARQLDEAMTQRALATIHRNTKALSTIIKDLLDISSITSGKLRLQVEPTDLVPVIEAAIESIRPAAIAKSIHFHFQITPPHPTPNTQHPTPNIPYRVLGDPDRIQQIVWNLLSNAIKFTPQEGQVEIHLSQFPSASSHPPTPTPPTPHPTPPTLYAQIQVTDTGIGIDSIFLPYVFDRFSQADMTITKPHGGLGLGLAIVRHLTEMQGGTVQVHSDGEGHGTTFIVRLPLLPIDASDDASVETDGRNGDSQSHEVAIASDNEGHLA